MRNPAEYRGEHPCQRTPEKTAPSGRRGALEEIALLRTYPFTKEAGCITGQNICVKGGAYL